MSPPEFYIGYEPQAPPRLARFLRRVVLTLILTGLGLAAVLAVSQKPFDPGEFEYGVVREFSGLLLESPVPTLLALEPLAGKDPPAGFTRFLLVAPGKFGAAHLVDGMDGSTVELRGTLIHRGRQAMIEVIPQSVHPSSTETETLPTVDSVLGEHTLVGEIVDSKCYLGVMKPGREKTHRGCAVRCISGGIPPLLRVTDLDGEPTHLLLVGETGEPINRQILDFVSEPVAITGTVRRVTDQLVLFASPGSIRRLSH